MLLYPGTGRGTLRCVHARQLPPFDPRGKIRRKSIRFDNEQCQATRNDRCDGGGTIGHHRAKKRATIIHTRHFNIFWVTRSGNGPLYRPGTIEVLRRG